MLFVLKRFPCRNLSKIRNPVKKSFFVIKDASNIRNAIFPRYFLRLHDKNHGAVKSCLIANPARML
jgi:hypothetical protein